MLVLRVWPTGLVKLPVTRLPERFPKLPDGLRPVALQSFEEAGVVLGAEVEPLDPEGR